MDTKDFLQAMNEIDNKFIDQADIFAPVKPVKIHPVSQALRWVGTAAACLLVTVGVVLVCVMNLLPDTGTPVAQSDLAGSAQSGAPALLSELPELSFPTREELGGTWVNSFGGIDRDMATQGLTERKLTTEEVASIWGQETLSWEGVNPEDAYDIVGIAYVDDENEIGLVTLWGYDKSEGDSAIGRGLHSFSIDIRMGDMPVETLVSNAPAKASQIWGTEVTTSAWYDGESHLTAEFLREGEEPVGLRVYASAQEGDSSEETLKELLTRLVSQSLRPENTLRISQLEHSAPVPLAELPELIFPTREEAGLAQTSGSETFAMPDLTKRPLSEKEIASIWGQDVLRWEGVDPGEDFEIAGTALIDDQGEIDLVTIYGYDKGTAEADKPYGLYSFQISLCPGALPEEPSKYYALTKTSQVWKTDVTASARYYTSGACFTAEFLREGEEPVGLRVSAAAAQEGDFSEEAMKELLTRLASQCLRPGNVFQISQLNGPSPKNDSDSLPAYGAEQEFALVPSEDGTEEFLALFSDDISYRSSEDKCWNVTPDFVKEHTDYRVFKFQNECDFYLLYQNEIFSLGSGFGGFGLTSLALADLNGDGLYELYYTCSSGSGVHASRAGYFDPASKADNTLYEFSLGELMLVCRDGQLTVCSCSPSIPHNGRGYAEMTVSSEAGLGTVACENGEIQWKEEAWIKEAAEQVAQMFVDSCLAEKEYPLSECFYEGLCYQPVTWHDNDLGDNDLQVCCQIIFKLENPDDPMAVDHWFPMNAQKGTGKYEGCRVIRFSIYAKKENGQWVITSSKADP